jgi:hypothetical protein
MKTIEDIAEDLQNGNYHLSLHSSTRMIERNISQNEIAEASRNIEIIEDYPDDKYEHSCLLLGFLNDEIPIHIQVTRTSNKELKIITLYYPDPNKWSDNFKERM